MYTIFSVEICIRFKYHIFCQILYENRCLFPMYLYTKIYPKNNIFGKEFPGTFLPGNTFSDLFLFLGIFMYTQNTSELCTKSYSIFRSTIYMFYVR